MVFSALFSLTFSSLVVVVTNSSGIHTNYVNKYIVNYMEHTFMFTFQNTIL
jgi:histidinol phosphatase-like enzyme